LDRLVLKLREPIFPVVKVFSFWEYFPTVTGKRMS